MNGKKGGCREFMQKHKLQEDEVFHWNLSIDRHHFDAVILEKHLWFNTSYMFVFIQRDISQKVIFLASFQRLHPIISFKISLNSYRCSEYQTIRKEISKSKHNWDYGSLKFSWINVTPLFDPSHLCFKPVFHFSPLTVQGVREGFEGQVRLQIAGLPDPSQGSAIRLVSDLKGRCKNPTFTATLKTASSVS